ncbi:MAG: sugar kinase, partial [Lachnospiraceae bacterium]|nr:sugar kinase [Lachnospiraceae bacterium]
MNQKQITNIEVKKNNRNRIFRYICKCGTVSNPDISYATKMSLPTVTMLTKELMAEGLVEEVGELKSTGGRRAKALSVVANARQAAGLDITRHHIGLVLVNLTGEVIKYERISLPYFETEEYYRSVNENLERFLDECGAVRERILGLGISFPGIIDLKKELVSDSHVLGVR